MPRGCGQTVGRWKGLEMRRGWARSTGADGKVVGGEALQGVRSLSGVRGHRQGNPGCPFSASKAQCVCPTAQKPVRDPPHWAGSSECVLWLQLLQLGSLSPVHLARHGLL